MEIMTIIILIPKAKEGNNKIHTLKIVNCLQEKRVFNLLFKENTVVDTCGREFQRAGQ